MLLTWWLLLDSRYVGVPLAAEESLCCQVQFTLDANFKLDDLLKLELHKFADEVGEIVDCAQKEEKMEQGLAKLKVPLISSCSLKTQTCEQNACKLAAVLLAYIHVLAMENDERLPM